MICEGITTLTRKPLGNLGLSLYTSFFFNSLYDDDDDDDDDLQCFFWQLMKQNA